MELLFSHSLISETRIAGCYLSDNPSLPVNLGPGENWKERHPLGHSILTFPLADLNLRQLERSCVPVGVSECFAHFGIPPAPTYWSVAARSFNLIRVSKTSFHSWRPTRVSEQEEKVWHHPCLHLCWVANEIPWWIWGPLKSMLILIIIKSTFKFTALWGRLGSIIFHRCVHCSGF